MNELRNRPTRTLLTDLQAARARRRWLRRTPKQQVAGSAPLSFSTDEIVVELNRRGIYPDFK
jgi:hypothetical protein